jgi:transcription termination factor Rho
MTVLDRGELERSPLADLHAIAAELGVEGFRRLRREELVTAIVDHAGDGGEAGGDTPEGDAETAGRDTPDDAAEVASAGARPARRRRGSGRERVASDPDPEGAESPADERERRPPAREDRARQRAGQEDEVQHEPRTGVLDILPNGSGFLRGETLAPSRDDVHVSPAQIRRCELRAGDEVSGPVRGPRRSERHPSLVHVETVNGAPAEPPAERPAFEELPPAYATERLAAPEELASAPLGKGSRVAVLDPLGAEGPPLLRRLVAALREASDELTVSVALAGARPEEVAEWRRVETTVVGGGADGPIDDQARAAELAVERAKRVAERGGDAVLFVDSLAALAPDAARRIFAAARRLEGAGSLTVIATLAASDELARLATTRVVLEAGKGPGGAEPAQVSADSGTVRADLLGT